MRVQPICWTRDKVGLFDQLQKHLQTMLQNIYNDDIGMYINYISMNDDDHSSSRAYRPMGHKIHTGILKHQKFFSTLNQIWIAVLRHLYC